jgi:hypothetical protein
MWFLGDSVDNVVSDLNLVLYVVFLTSSHDSSLLLVMTVLLEQWKKFCVMQ